MHPAGLLHNKTPAVKRYTAVNPVNTTSVLCVTLLLPTLMYTFISGTNCKSPRGKFVICEFACYINNNICFDDVNNFRFWARLEFYCPHCIKLCLASQNCDSTIYCHRLHKTSSPSDKTEKEDFHWRTHSIMDDGLKQRKAIFLWKTNHSAIWLYLAGKTSYKLI